MKRYGNLYSQIYNMDNLRLAHDNAKRGKTWYKEIKEVDDNLDFYLKKLQRMLIDKTYATSGYKVSTITDGKKQRIIYKLPYFPDRICQWAILQIIEPILITKLTNDTYSAIPKRGIHLALKRVKVALRDTENAKYCLKLDMKKYYPSIDHELLNATYANIFKDEELLWLLGEIIDSTESGIPIGNYISQWSGNIFLAKFDHWIKEVKGVKYYFRYMDDMVILAGSKVFLHDLFKDIQEYAESLRLTIKHDHQVFPVDIRGIDFVGYRCFRNYTLLRKSIAKSLKCKMKILRKKQKLTLSDLNSISSYKGWIGWANCYNLWKKHIKLLEVNYDKINS